MANRIHDSATIGKDVSLGDGNEIGPRTVLEDGVRLGDGNRILAGAFIGRGTTIGNGNSIHMYAIVGHEPQDHAWKGAPSFTRIGDGNEIRELVTIHRGTKEGSETRIGNRNMIMSQCHIAHDCVLGDGIVMVNLASLTGYCTVEDGAVLSGMTGLHQFTRVGRLCMYSALSASNKDLPPFTICGGRPAVAQGVNLIGLRRARLGRDVRDDVKRAFRLLYRSGLPTSEALARIEAECASEEARHMVRFVRASKRGIVAWQGDVHETLNPKKGIEAAREGEDEQDGEQEAL